jgi:autotransporter-associated beta strand protein
MSTLFSLLLAAATAFGGSATWNLNPTSGDWNTAANWTPETVPNGVSDTATFDASNVTGISLSDFTQLDGIVFNSGANAFTINTQSEIILIYGAGITNNSGVTQNFVIPVFNISFYNQATAGTSTVFTMSGGSFGSAAVAFNNDSNAGSSTFIMLGATTGQTQGGYVVFNNGATAADGTFIVNGASVRNAVGGFILFEDSSSAGNASIVNYDSFVPGGGGSTNFLDNSSGGTARIKVVGQGELDIRFHQSPGVTIGSIEGSGVVFLGQNTLSVGKNNLDTTFSGRIEDGDILEPRGSLAMIGKGRLTLTNANTYTGGTTIQGGKLIVNNGSGSGTGDGPVEVTRGVLGGNGTISGEVTVGAGSGKGAFLSPGKARDTAVLTLLNSLTFNADGGYRCALNSDTASSDEVFASGVTINSGAQFLSADAGASALTPGIVLTVINNTAATPIAGTFSNLADGSSITIGPNTFHVNYEGGDGNDLTLTVVP